MLLVRDSGSMKSSGVELSLSTTNIKNDNFSWTTSFIYSHTNNEITDLDTYSYVRDLVSGTGYLYLETDLVDELDVDGETREGPTAVTESEDVDRTDPAVDSDEADTGSHSTEGL